MSAAGDWPPGRGRLITLGSLVEGVHYPSSWVTHPSGGLGRNARRRRRGGDPRMPWSRPGVQRQVSAPAECRAPRRRRRGAGAAGGAGRTRAGVGDRGVGMWAQLGMWAQ
ncbi:hypothetical protein FM103_10410 [Corynebacterium xerosis]|nr:hypothetical protein FM103_10410 [Corynebacterium xerosis]